MRLCNRWHEENVRPSAVTTCDLQSHGAWACQEAAKSHLQDALRNSGSVISGMFAMSSLLQHSPGCSLGVPQLVVIVFRTWNDPTLDELLGMVTWLVGDGGQTF